MTYYRNVCLKRWSRGSKFLIGFFFATTFFCFKLIMFLFFKLYTEKKSHTIETLHKYKLIKESFIKLFIIIFFLVNNISTVF